MLGVRAAIFMSYSLTAVCSTWRCTNICRTPDFEKPGASREKDKVGYDPLAVLRIIDQDVLVLRVDGNGRH